MFKAQNGQISLVPPPRELRSRTLLHRARDTRRRQRKWRATTIMSSRSSWGSASTWQQASKRAERAPPVPYRVAPLAYSPPVMCYCNRKALCWTSWSDNNPGRRYCRCPAGMTDRDCGFFSWMDREATTHERDILRDLRDAVWQLRREKEERLQLDMLVDKGKLHELDDENAEMPKENSELKDYRMMQIEAAMANMNRRKWFVRLLLVVVVMYLFYEAA